MIKTASLVSSVAICCAIFACSDDRIAGNTTQTENTVTARTISVDSVLPEWNHPMGGVTVVTLRMDSSNFDFRQSDSSSRDLVVQNESDSAMPFEIVYWDKPARLGRIRVRIDSQLLRPGARFIMRWKQPLQLRSDPVAVWKSISDSQRLALTTVLVANFENGSDTTLLPTHPLWETYSSTDSGPDSSQFSSHSFIAAGGGRPGKALSATYWTRGSGYVVLKTPLVFGDGQRNIRAMDSLVFCAKGTQSSNLFTAFDHANAFKAWKLDTLDTVWTRIRIRPSDFIPASNPNGGNRGWVAVRDSATALTFILYNGTKFWLDDIRIYGIDQDDLK